ncbi:MAG: hypothetical protein ACE5K9_08885 [Candidatus Methylomirabilales bacterium]
MTKRQFLLLVPFIALGIGTISRADSPYTWVQVVERGIPNFNDYAVAQEAFMETSPIDLSFSSGVQIVFVFVNHQGQTYGVYHNRENNDVVGIARLDRHTSSPQGLVFYEFYVDDGLLKGNRLTGHFVYIHGTRRIFAAVCRIADMANEARAHTDCPQRA